MLKEQYRRCCQILINAMLRHGGFNVLICIISLNLITSCASNISEANLANARIHYDIGVSNLERGDFRGALSELLIAVDLNPEMPQTHNALGLVYHALEKSKEALEHYERALELKPDFSQAHNNFGILLIDLGRYDEAIEHFKKALNDILYNTPSLAEGNMGWAYYKNGEVDKGRIHLRNAIAQSPKFCRGYLWLAQIGIDIGDSADVIVNARRFDKHCLNNENNQNSREAEYIREMHYYQGLAYLKQDDRQAARQSFASCATTESNSKFGVKCTQSLRSVE